jgi:hypothetical protein
VDIVSSPNPETVVESPVEPGHPQEGLKSKRKEKRYPGTGHAEVVVNKGISLFRGRILNTSNTGCYIQTSATARVPLGSPAELVAGIKGAAGIKLSAEVRSCQPRVRIGFRFITMDDEMRNKLSKLIATMEQSHP